MQCGALVFALAAALFLLTDVVGDRLFASAMLVLAWLGETFSAVCVRSPLSTLIFPRAFAALFCLCAAYFYLFPVASYELILATTYSATLFLVLLFARIERDALGSVVTARRQRAHALS